MDLSINPLPSWNLPSQCLRLAEASVTQIYDADAASNEINGGLEVLIQKKGDWKKLTGLSACEKEAGFRETKRVMPVIIPAVSRQRTLNILKGSLWHFFGYLAKTGPAPAPVWVIAPITIGGKFYYPYWIRSNEIDPTFDDDEWRVHLFDATERALILNKGTKLTDESYYFVAHPVS